MRISARLRVVIAITGVAATVRASPPSSRLDEYLAGRAAFADERYADARARFDAARLRPHDSVRSLPTFDLEWLPGERLDRDPSDARELGWLLCSVGKTHEARGDDDLALWSYSQGACTGALVALARRMGKLLDELVRVERDDARPFWLGAQLYAAAGAPCKAASKLATCGPPERVADCEASDGLRRTYEARCAERTAEKDLPGIRKRLEAPRISFYEADAAEAPSDGRASPTVSVDEFSVSDCELAVVDGAELPTSVNWARVVRGVWLSLGPCGAGEASGPYYVGLDEYRIHDTARSERVRPDGLLQLLAAARGRPGTWVELMIDLARVSADSDHDGLTDLLEERIATDPTHRDSDRDGLDDASDPLPLTPHERIDGTQQVWHAMLAELDGFAIGTLRIPRALTIAPARGRRVLALPPTFERLYVRKFGSFPSAELDDVAFDRGDRRAFSCMRQGRVGQTCYRLARDASGWHVVGGGYSVMY